MGLGCPICSENLEKQPAEASAAQQHNDINIACTPCGHLFHTYCINKWLTGNLASSKQCPCCRKAVPQLRVLPLFPNGYEESVLEDSFQGGGIIPCSCNVTISSLRHHIKEADEKLKEKDEKLRETLEISEIHKSSAKEFKSKLDKEKVRSEHYLFQYKQLESLKTYSQEKEKECTRLNDELKKYHVIDSIVRGVQDEVEIELPCYPATPETIKTLLEIQFTLKQEIQSISKKLDKVKKEQEDVRIFNSQYRKKYVQLKQDYAELKKVHDNSKSFGDTPNRSIGPLDLNKAIYGSRTPLVMQSGHAEQFKNCKKELIDEDIPLMQPFGQKLKRPNKKPQTQTENAEVLGINSSTDSIDFIPATPLLPKRRLYKSKTNDVDLDFKKQKTEGILNVPHNSIKDYSRPCSSKSLKKVSNNKTISISSSDDDDDYMALRGGIPGMKITPRDADKNKMRQFANNNNFSRKVTKK